MTGMLASVNSLDEVQLILNTSVDIIDLKQPELGALGALAHDTIKQIVSKVNQQKPVSATIGDLPMQPELIFNAVKTMISCQTNYIKIGFFPGGDWHGTLSKLSEFTKQGHQLIAVLFADNPVSLHTVELLSNAGFYGVMLDTMDKTKGSLTQIMSHKEIATFVQTAKNHQLLCGLAGSLTNNDIPELMKLEADYLGFRGALCEKHQRTEQISQHAVQTISRYFDEEITACI